MSETGPGGIRSLLQVTPATAQPASAAWRVGQTLEAVVRDTGPGGVLLRIGGSNVTARSTVPLQLGQQLQLQVAAMSPQVTLRILQPLTRETLLADASRSLLPRQAPQAPLLQTLVTVLANNPRSLQSLPPDVRSAAQALLNAAPTAGSLADPGQLRAALDNSGLLFESKLFAMTARLANPQASGLVPGAAAGLGAGQANAAILAGDAKGLLANLLATLFGALSSRPRSWQGGEQTPPNPRRFVPLAAAAPRLAPPADPQGLLTALARQTDGALARMQLTQVNLLSADGQLPWLFELPVRDGSRTDQLQLLLDREPAASGEERDKIWTVRVSLDFPETGPLHCTVTLQGGAVSTSWWAERRASVQLVNAHLAGLAERIQTLGMTVAGMRCVHGRPPDPEPESSSTQGGRLFDEHV